MAYTPIYTRKNFVNNSAPAINATNLNDIEGALVSLENGLQTAAADTDTNTAAIATINGEISDLNNLIDAILPDDSESGNPAVITDAFAAECKSLVLTLEPIQSGSGTPSPANPRPITGRTQSTVKRTGKNVFPFSLAAIKIINTLGTWNGNHYSQYGLTYDIDVDANGNITTITVNGTTTQYAYFMLAPVADINAALDGSYILNGCPASGSNSTFYVAIGGNVNDYGTGAPFSTPATGTNSFIYIQGGQTVNNLVFKPMIRIENTSDDFEPYDGESIIEAYGQTLYKASADITGGEASNKSGIADLGDLAWTYYGPYNDQNLFYTDSLIGIIAHRTDDDIYGVCSIYEQYPNSAIGTMGNYGMRVRTSDGRIYVNDTRYTDANTFKTAVTGQKFVYDLETPVLISLTPQNLTLLKGDNVITTDADNVDVEYKADIALYIAKQLGGTLGNRGAKSAPAEEPADDTKEEEKTDDEIIEPVTKEAKK